ncbi:MAG: lysine--tRNA ligase, partial [Duncaniella sp.]|nr:lysine--tRNA ligase [Duncaniella sp.]
MNAPQLSEQEQIRRQSLEEMRKMGIDPYPAAEYPVDAYASEIKESFTDDAPERPVCVAGRVMGRRIMGKASFMELQDSTG